MSSLLKLHLFREWVCIYTPSYHGTNFGDQRTTFGSWFSGTLLVPGIKFTPPALMEIASTHWPSLPAQGILFLLISFKFLYNVMVSFMCISYVCHFTLFLFILVSYCPHSPPGFSVTFFPTRVLLCSFGWLWIHRGPPASAWWMLAWRCVPP